MHGRLLVLLGAAALLSGCGEFAYKTGAGADQLAGDETACRKTADFKACMHDKGWSITNLDGDAAEPAPAATAAAPAGSPAALPPGAPPPAPGSAPIPTVPAPPAADPLAPVPITAWVRFGGGGPDGDIADCVATLGPAHEPDKVHKTVTRALLRCMREKDWRAL